MTSYWVNSPLEICNITSQKFESNIFTVFEGLFCMVIVGRQHEGLLNYMHPIILLHITVIKR